MKFGMTAKLALLLALVGALAAGLTGFYAYQASRALLVDSAQNKLLTSTQVLARRIVLTHEEIAEDLQVMARYPVAAAILQKPDATQEDQLAILFSLLMQTHPAYLQMRLISASDHGLERVRLDRVGAVPVRVRGNDLQEKGHYAYVFETLKLPPGASYLSRISINHEGGLGGGLEQPTLQLATPVVGPGGAVLGVVVVNVDLNGLFTLLAIDLPVAFKLFLANGQGDILLHPDSRKTFGFDRGRRVLLQDEFASTQAVVAGSQRQAVFQARMDGDAAPPVVAAFIAQNIPVASAENRLILGLAQPLSEVLAQSQQLGHTVLQIVFGLCLACLLLAVLVSRAWTRPINAITAAAQRMANGLPPGPLPLHRKDELGALARRFHHMHTQVAQHLAALQDNQDELEHLAQHDMLTGLPNRRLFQQRLEQTLAHARRYHESVYLLFIDLDAFKAINDTLGHDAGDVVLQVVAQRMQAMLREVDTVARLGGDEFVVLLGAPTPHAHLAGIAEKLLQGVREPIVAQARTVQLSASIGVSRYPQDGQTAAELLASADQAMYRTKLAGRNGFCFFSTDPVDDIAGRGAI
jgi:diguanylate cyclase (GGDEF)-like protein